MSSPRGIHPSEAVIRSTQRQPSPVLLPSEDDTKVRFVNQFNATYSSIGWRIESSGGQIIASKATD